MKMFLRWTVLLGFVALAAHGYAKRIPNLTFHNLAGSEVKTNELHGSITVLNFWATWCGPCQEEMPMLSKLTEAYAGKKVRFVAVSVDEDPGNKKNRAKIDQFFAAHKPAMEIWLGADLGSLDGVQLGNVLPATLILDENGEVITRIMGQAREDDVKAPLEWLLNGRSGTPPAAAVKRF